MEQEKEKLERFFRAVNTVTDKQVNAILSDAEEERNSILSAAKESAAEAKERHLKDSMKITSGKCVRMVSRAELDMKKEVLICREKLTEELFGRVYKKLEDYRKSADYEKQLCSSIKEEGDLSGATVFISPADMRLKDKLGKAAGKGVNIEADESIVYGGFTVLRAGKGTVTDRTFDCAIREQQGLFASKNLIGVQEGNGN